MKHGQRRWGGSVHSQPVPAWYAGGLNPTGWTDACVSVYIVFVCEYFCLIRISKGLFLVKVQPGSPASSQGGLNLAPGFLSMAPINMKRVGFCQRQTMLDTG